MSSFSIISSDDEICVSQTSEIHSSVGMYDWRFVDRMRDTLNRNRIVILKITNKTSQETVKAAVEFAKQVCEDLMNGGDPKQYPGFAKLTDAELMPLREL